MFQSAKVPWWQSGNANHMGSSRLENEARWRKARECRRCCYGFNLARMLKNIYLTWHFSVDIRRKFVIRPNLDLVNAHFLVLSTLNYVASRHRPTTSILAWFLMKISRFRSLFLVLSILLPQWSQQQVVGKY